ncbi:MAG: SDR family NAD(P)-dependent oxidoreductase [Rubrivivax sp.]|nr:SDR family NAD(P)-dependent oxidoreductase [Rubrivivax sp.]
MSDFLARVSHFSPKRLALLADELNDRVAQLEAAPHEPIAIVGIGCRLPGAVDSADAYWRLLQDGVDAISEVPADRWDIDAWYDPDPDVAGKMATRWGGFVGAVDGFDAAFFGISPREAQSMDPQQRLLLEVSWRALEDAGIAPPSLEGSRTGVFLGVSAGDYFQLLRNAGGMAGFDAYTASGTAHSIASGRLSYTLGLRGPSVSVDTACSSSLVAIHQAVASLRRRESDLALAGGVNLILGPDITVALSRAHMMAPDGRCKAFDARADGFVRGEGCGMLVLQRLSDARAAGRRVLAVIRGIAANQDGRSNGLTAPNGPAQEDVLREALADAGLQPHDIGYVEAHGTGTSLGDPIEVQALHAVLGAGREPGQPLQVGSVKAAIGHLEAAAGVAGLIKAVLVLRHGQIPGQLHLREPNPYIPWDRMAVQVPRETQPWPAGPSLRRAGVSSFGFSGTNVHVVLEEAPARPAVPAAAAAAVGADRPLHVFTVSGRSEAALAQSAAACADAISRSSAPWPDLVHAATVGRAHFAHRAAVVAASPAEAAQRLALLAERLPSPETALDGLHLGTAPARPPRVAFLFTGQGSQQAGMARSLYERHPAFRASIDRCDELLRPWLPRPLLEVLLPANASPAGEPAGGSNIDDTSWAQPALFAVEYALAQLWLSWGVVPKALMGHSLGEIVAACVAGVFSLEDALRLVAARGALMGALPRKGGMAAVTADEATVRSLLARHASQLDIAALNGPASTVVSGSETALSALTAELQARGIATTRLQVSHAFHSPLMEPMLGRFAEAIAGIRMQAPQIDLISNVSGERAGPEVATPAYWCRHVRATVQFAPSMRTLAAAGIDVFLEVGPHPVLLGMGANCVEGQGAGHAAPRWLPSLRRGRDDWATLLASLAELHVAGVAVNWGAFDAPWARAHADLPGYPFQRQRYWVGNGTGSAAGNVGAAPAAALSHARHPLLGHEIVHPLSEQRLFETRLHTSLQPWLRDHVIQGSVVLPSPVCMEIALAAARQLWPVGRGAMQVDDLTVHRALPVDGEQPVTLHAVLAAQDDGSATLELLTLETERPGAPREERHAVLASARLRNADAAVAAPAALADVQARTTEAVDVAAYYAWLERLGLHFGPRFRGVQQMWRCDGEVLARVAWPDSLTGHEADYHCHPALLDACLHVVGAALPGAAGTLADAFLLMNVQRLRLFGPLGRAAWVHVQVAPEYRLDLARRETFTATLNLLDDAGAPRAAFEGMSFKRARPGALRPAPRLPQRVQEMLYEVVWRDAPGRGPRPTPACLVERFLPELPAIAARHRFDRYADFVPALDRLASGYVHRALAELGLALTPGRRVTAGDRATLGVEERHQRLFERLLEIGTEDGWLRRDGPGHVVTGQPAPADPEPLGAALAEAHPDAQAELQLTQRCARELANVMRGRTDPLALLFPGGSLADTERLYRDSPPAQAYNGLVARLVEQLAMAHEAPEGRPLRVLEIGAGTGSTTAYVLPPLAQAAGAAGRALHYTFTDVSPLFLNRARERFGLQPGFDTRVLDIGAPLPAQGFDAGAYDIVIGANVLHATPDLERTLTHTRALLAPGGTLVLLEGVTPQRFGDLTVGLLEGWWAFTDTHRRQYALMSRAQWLALLAERSFAEAAALPGDVDDPVWRQQAIFVASVPTATAEIAVPPRPASRWLLLPDGGGMADALAQALRARGDRVDALPMQAGSQSDMAAALDALLKSGPAPAGVLALPALDLASDDTLGAEAFMAAQQRALMPCLALAQALAVSSTPLPLWLVTRGAQPAADDAAHPAQATLWGLGHVIAVEQPQLDCRRIDLDPEADALKNVTALLVELDAPGREDQIAWRGLDTAPHRRVRRLLPASRQRSPRHALALHAGRSYLVTGGLRGLGLRVARWLVERGARHVVLMGRQGASAAALAEIAALQARGASVTVHQGDVADEGDVAGLMARLSASAAPLAGVVHAAGALSDAVLTGQDWNHFETVMAAKVRGSWNLHRLAGELDFLVFFSSGASVGGSAGQANHAAANAFEDALAWHRNARGQPTLSINWGPWAEIGAAADRHLAQPGGLRPIAPADGIAALEHLMAVDAHGRFDPAQTAVLATDWSHLRSAREAGSEPSLLRDLVLPALSLPTVATPASAAAAAPARQPAAAEPSLAERLAAALPNRRRVLLREHVRTLAARVLGLPGAEALPPEEPLRQLGLDSLMAVELRNLLGKAVGHTLPATVTFDHPSVSALADHLAATTFKAHFTAGPVSTSPASSVSATSSLASSMAPAADTGAPALDDLDADALAERLLSRLDQIGQPENS